MRSRWIWPALAGLAFALVCALLLAETRWGGLRISDDDSAPAVDLAPPQAPPSAMPAPTPGVTNEALHAMLTEEREKMGIKEIGPDAEQPQVSHRLGFGQPGTRKQAEAAIRRMMLLRRQIDDAAGKQQPVPIDGSVAPVLSQPDTQSGQAVGSPRP